VSGLREAASDAAGSLLRGVRCTRRVMPGGREVVAWRSRGPIARLLDCHRKMRACRPTMHFSGPRARLTPSLSAAEFQVRWAALQQRRDSNR
jgi:hypothetical protein